MLNLYFAIPLPLQEATAAHNQKKAPQPFPAGPSSTIEEVIYGRAPREVAPGMRTGLAPDAAARADSGSSAA